MRIKRRSLEEIYLILAGILLVLPIIMFRGLSYGFLMMFFFSLFVILKGKIYIDKTWIILFFLAFITFAFSKFRGMGHSWESAATKQFTYFLMIFFISFSLKYLVDKDLYKPLFIGVKIGLILQIFWCFLQYFLFVGFRYDINTIVFTNIFHFTEKASRIIGDRIRVSGFGWHPGLLVPIIVLSMMIFKSPIIKLFVIGVAIISDHSTTLLAAIICLIFIIINNASLKKHLKISKRSFLSVVVVFAILLLFFMGSSNLKLDGLDSFGKLISRIEDAYFGNKTDLSTYYHLRYYTYYPEIFKKTGVLDFLFGVGYECSGFPYTVYLGQYESYGAWSVETDIINFLIGRGILWFVIFYGYLIRFMIKGFKFNYKYGVIALSLLICGILYNNQFDWVIIIEMVLFKCLDYKKDVLMVENERLSV